MGLNKDYRLIPHYRLYEFCKTKNVYGASIIILFKDCPKHPSIEEAKSQLYFHLNKDYKEKPNKQFLITHWRKYNDEEMVEIFNTHDL